MSFGGFGSSGFGAASQTTSPFGAQQTQAAPAFGQQQQNPSPFGGGGFGQQQQQTTAFGGGASTGFGSSAPSTGFGATPGGFGQASSATPFGGGSAFGAKPATTGFGFGQSSSASAGGFGSAPVTSGFGAAPATGGFGQQTASTPFGGGGGGFGQQQQTSTTPFGGSGGGFGQQQQSTFGSNTSTTPAFGGFGGSAPGGGFGQGGAMQQNRGTRGVAWRKTQEIDQSSSGTRTTVQFNSISCMPEYVTKSAEELRWEDYQDGNKGGTQAGQAPGMFGQTQTTQSNPFGQPASTPFGAPQNTSSFGGGAFGGSAFGASSTPAFGAASAPAFGTATGTGASTPAFGGSAFGASSTPAFGASSTPAFGTTTGASTPAFGGSAFGASSTPAFGATSAPAFGATSTPAFGASSTPAFGAANTASASTPAFGGSAFGASSTPAFGASSTPAFGAAGTAAPTPAFGSSQAGASLFSSPTSAPSTSFGAAQSTPAFGGFGTTPKPATGGFQFNSAGGAATPAFGTGTSGLGSTPGFGTANQTPAFGGGGLFSSTTATPTFQPASTPATSFGAAQTTSLFNTGTGVASQPASNIGPLSPYGNMPEAPKVTPLPEYKVGLTQRILAPPSAGPPKPVALITPRSLTPHGGGKIRPRISAAATRMSKSPAEFFASSTLRGTPVSKMNTPAGDGGIFVPRDDPRRLLIRDELPLTPSAQKYSSGKTPRQNGTAATRNGFHGDHASPSPSSLTLKSISPKSTGGNSVGRSTMSVLPMLERDGYFVEPSMNQLSAMAQDDPESLSNVSNFTVGRKGYGSVRWIDPVDIRGLDLDSIVTLARGSIDVYPDADVKPPVGQRLNCPAIITMLKVFKIDKTTGEPTKDAEVVEKYTRKLKRVCADQGAKFISYDGESGEWKFEVEHFSRYGLDESSDEDEAFPKKVEDKAPGGGEETYSDVSEASDDIQLGLKNRGFQEATIDKEVPAHGTVELFDVGAEGILRGRSGFDQTRSPIFLQHQHIDTDEDMDEDDDFIEGFNPLSSWKPTLVAHGITAPRARIIPKRCMGEARPPGKPVSTRNLADFGAFMKNSFQVGWGLHGKMCSPTAGSTVVIENTTKRLEQGETEREFLLEQLKLHYSHSFPVEEDVTTSTPRLKLQCSRSSKHLENLTAQYQAICLKYVGSDGLESIHNTRIAESEVWDLINVLFSLVPAEEDPLADDDSDVSDQGNLMSLSDMQRRAAFSTWLKSRTYKSVQKQLNAKSGDNIGSARKILALLSCHDLASAALTAAASGNVRLSTLLATGGTMTSAVNSINEQQKVWSEEGYTSHIEEELSQIYDLLGGNVDTAMHVVSNDWKRAFGLHLWYATPRTASITTALESYLMAVEEGKAPFPSPWHSSVAFDGAAPPTDSAFELIKMFCQSEEWQSEAEKKMAASGSLADLLCPLGTTPDVQHAGFYWHLFCVLESIGVIQGNLTDEANAAVTRTIMSYISEIESIGGIAHWAIYVALHIPDDMQREMAVRDLLSRYCEEWQHDDQVVSFLVEKLGIPVALLEESKAIYSAIQNDDESLLESLMDAEDWQGAHAILKQVVAPKWLLAKHTNGDTYALHEDLIGALEELEQYQDCIDPQSWRVGGGLYLSFFRLKDKMIHTEQITAEDEADIESIQNALDDAYTEAENNTKGYTEKAAYAIIARELSSLSPLPSLAKGSMALRYSNVQSNIQTIAHALACNLA